MTTYVLATNSVSVSDRLCDHLVDDLDPTDTVHAVNSQRGGTSTDAEDVEAGKEALRAVESRLGDVADVETHQIIEGNSPAADVFAVADRVGADQLVIGIRKRSAASKLIFGSVAQDILLNSEYPMRVVPRD